MTVESKRSPPIVWHGRRVACIWWVREHRYVCVRPRIPEYDTIILRPHFAAAQQPLQQRRPLTRCAATLAPRARVGAQSRLGLQVLLPGHIAGMVIGDAHPPLLDRHLDHRHLHDAVRADGLDLAAAPERVRAGIGRVGQHVVHRPVVGGDPPNPALADRAAREQLSLAGELGDDLPAEPQRSHNA